MKKKLVCLLMALLLFTVHSSTVLAATTFNPKSASGYGPAPSNKEYRCWLGGTSERVAADMIFADENNTISVCLSAYMRRPNNPLYVGIITVYGFGSAEAYLDSIANWPITSATGDYRIRASVVESLSIR